MIVLWHSTFLSDGRYGVPRSAALSIDEQQRMQQYNHMLYIQQSAPSVSGAPRGTDRGVCIFPGGNVVGIVSGLNRTMPMARPRFQGIAPPSMNSGSMISSSMAVMPSPVNVPSGVGSGPGNSVLRPRDALNMMRVSCLPFSFYWAKTACTANLYPQVLYLVFN